MSFRLTTFLWVFAVVASAMATFGLGGTIAAGLVVGFWWWVFNGSKPRISFVASVLLIAGVIVVLLALLLPAVQSSRSWSSIAHCQHNLKQISLALLNYHDAHGQFPPPYVADANGKPIHSWRVLILPFIEEQWLYQRYSLSEPWNGPNNSKLATQIPQVYRCPSHRIEKSPLAEETQYFAIVGPDAAWNSTIGRKIREIRDGTSNTILLIEASGLGVNWMEPRDVSIDEAIDLLTKKSRSGHTYLHDKFLTTTYYENSYRNVAYCDGRVEWMGQLSDADIAKALLTIAGGEIIPPDVEGEFGAPDVSRTIVKWGTVYALCTFILLSLLPIRWIAQRASKAAAKSTDGDA